MATIKGKTPVSKPAIKKAAAKPADAKVEQTQRADETPEAKRTPAEQKRAAEKLFANADDAALRGYPPEITREQHENIVRRAALGY